MELEVFRVPVTLFKAINANCSVSVEFFDDIYIPSYSLQVLQCSDSPLLISHSVCLSQVPSEYSDRKWMWNYTEGASFTTEVGDMVRAAPASASQSHIQTALCR